jgi:hypothetical protein
LRHPHGLAGRRRVFVFNAALHGAAYEMRNCAALLHLRN